MGQTIPVIAPDGSVWDIPQDKVHEAIKAGGKLAIDVVGPDKKTWAIPADKVHDALKSGGQLAPPSVPNPANSLDMHGEKFGALDTIGYVASDPLGAIGAAGRGMKQTEQDLQDTKNDGAITSGVKHVADASVGAIKAGINTGVGVANLGIGAVNKVGNAIPSAVQEPDITKIGEQEAGQPDQFDNYDGESASLTPKGTSQKVGAVGENIAEFLMGDAALKGMEIGAKLGLVQKVVKLANEHKVIGKALQIGMDSIRMGAVGTGQAMAHGEDAGDALKEGAIVGASGGLLEGGFAGAKAGYKAVKAAGGVKSVLSDAAGGVKSLFNEAAAAETVQPGLQGAVRSAASDVASAEGVVPQATKSISNVVENTADSVYAKSKGIFDKIDVATGNRFQPVKNALKENQKALREATSEEEAGKLMAKRVELEAAQEQVFNEASKSGVDKTTVEQARATYKRTNALYELDRNINFTYKGANPEVAPELAKDLPEKLNPDQLFGRINKLYKSGRLQEALGEAGAKKLYNDVGTAVKDGTKAISRAKLNKNIAKYVAYVTGTGAVGGGIVRHFLL